MATEHARDAGWKKINGKETTAGRHEKNESLRLRSAAVIRPESHG